MSLELRDLRLKVTVETDCALDSYATTNELEKAEAAREILHKWAVKQIEGATVLHTRLKREGLLGAHEGKSGQPREEDPE